MSRMLRIILGITAVVHVPVALGVAELGRRLGWPMPSLIGLGWALAGVFLFVGRARAGMPDRRGRHPALVRLVDIPYFIHWCACVCTLVPALVATLVAPLVDLARGAPPHLPMGVYMWTRTCRASSSADTACSYAGGGTASSSATCPYPASTRDSRASHRPALGPPHRHAHAPSLGPRLVAVRERSRAGSRGGHRRHGDERHRLPLGRGRRHRRAAREGRRLRVDGRPRLLRRRASPSCRCSGSGASACSGTRGVVIERDGAKLWLAAIDDTWTRRDDIARAMRARPEGATTVLLAHDPNRFDAAADAGANVVLSGHTHGGQIGVPFLYRDREPRELRATDTTWASTGAARRCSTCTPASARPARRCASASRPKSRSSRSARPREGRAASLARLGLGPFAGVDPFHAGEGFVAAVHDEGREGLREAAEGRRELVERGGRAVAAAAPRDEIRTPARGGTLAGSATRRWARRPAGAPASRAAASASRRPPR